MRNRNWVYPIIIICLVATPYLTRFQRAEAQVPTIPTRTPTPPPTSPPPTSPPPTSPPPTQVPPTNTPVSPTNTPVPQATTAVPTPAGGFLPTAEPCGTPPTVLSSGAINVRSGPGTDYAVLARLVAGEVRPIMGRAEFADWWLITLPDNSEGWVADFTVTVNGFTGSVPLVIAPPRNGSTPTPGAAWNPTPDPDCEPTPTSTPTATPGVTPPTTTATAPPTATPTATAADTGTTQNETPAADTTAAAAVASGAGDVTATPAPPSPPDATSAAATSTAIRITAAGAANTGVAATAVPLDEASASGGINFLPIAGILLILVGAAGFVVTRRQ